ncbi:MAG TPA: hypothetical protein VKA45_02055 [Gaiellaceae bacterium]|nr:hypothetical protein [Gaiellaceae bacterium]
MLQTTPPAPPARRAVRKDRSAAKAAKLRDARKKQNAASRARRAAAAALLPREEASSVNGTLLAGGLALFVLVLADTVFLTVSTGVFRLRT